MILDDIIAFFVSLIEAVFEASAALVNLIAAAIEGVVGLFVVGFSLGRLSRPKKEERRQSSHPAVSLGILAFILVFGLAVTIGPAILEREVSIVASDGYSAPFAAVVLETSRGEKHKRTDNSGNLQVPRFGLTAITVKDPRYVEETWQESELDEPLVVTRTVLGAGLDHLADRLLRPNKE
jgi:hypothetical protein